MMPPPSKLSPSTEIVQSAEANQLRDWSLVRSPHHDPLCDPVLYSQNSLKCLLFMDGT